MVKTTTTEQATMQPTVGALKMQDLIKQDMKLKDQFAGHENAGRENAGHENAKQEIAGQCEMLNLYSLL